MKPGSRTERVAQAMALIAAGHTPYRVAKVSGVSLRHLYRLLAAQRSAPNEDNHAAKALDVAPGT